MIQITKFILGAGLALFCRPDIPIPCLYIIRAGRAVTSTVDIPQMNLGSCITSIRRALVPLHRYSLIRPRDTATLPIHLSQMKLRYRKTITRRAFKPFHRLGMISFAYSKILSQCVFGNLVALLCRLTYPHYSRMRLASPQHSGILILESRLIGIMHYRGVTRIDGPLLVFLPHFEKMLYDQALFVIANLECYQATGKERYAEIAREGLSYVMRDMTDPDGGFYSAEDADSEGEEGKFYVWEPKEVLKILGKERGQRFCQIYNIVEGGNFRDESTGGATGDSIPHLQDKLSGIAKEMKITPQKLSEELDADRRKLFAVREKRIHPQKDDKILTDWNGLMISAFAQAAQALDDPAYLKAARDAGDYCLSTLRRKDGRLLKRSRRGNAGLPARRAPIPPFRAWRDW